MITAVLLAGTASLGGQMVGALFNEGAYFMVFIDKFSMTAVLGASFGGVFAPLYADLACGSIIAEGVITGTFVGYFELIGGWIDAGYPTDPIFEARHE